MNVTQKSNDTDASNASVGSSVVHTTKTSNVFRHNSKYSNPQEKFYVEYAEGGSATRIKKEKISWARSGIEKIYVSLIKSGYIIIETWLCEH